MEFIRKMSLNGYQYLSGPRRRVVGRVNLLYGRRGSVLAESWSRLGRMCTWGSNVGQDRVPNHGHGKEENKKGVGGW